MLEAGRFIGCFPKCHARSIGENFARIDNVADMASRTLRELAQGEIPGKTPNESSPPLKRSWLNIPAMRI
jgi:hypothetical protein